MTVGEASPNPLVTAILVQVGVSAFHFSVPLVVFDDQGTGDSFFSVKVVTENGADIRLNRSVTAIADGGLELLDSADVILVAGWGALDEAPTQALQDALRAAHARGAHVVGLCYGAYALAYSGLLDGKRASTHWMAEADFARRFPRVQLDTNALYVDEERLVTSAGTGAGLDCCLYLVRKLRGAREANRVARTLVLPPYREGGQAQFIDQPVPVTSQDALLSKLLEYTRDNLSARLSLDDLADRVAMSRRSFTRHFAKATGMTVKAWVENERLRKAKDLLETTDLSIEVVAEQSGFHSSVSFRQAFSRAVHVSPRDFRRAFRR